MKQTALLLLILLAIPAQAGEKETRAFIRDSWEKSIRFLPDSLPRQTMPGWVWDDMMIGSTRMP